jgi:TonB family protein
VQIRFLLLLGLAFTPLASAQNVFLALEDGTSPKMVKRVSLGRPQIEVDGKLQGSNALRFSLAKATVYRPGLVTISNFRVQTHHVESVNLGGSFNYELAIYGHATSDVPLEDCFLVLELNSWKNAGCLSVELHDLAPGKIEDLDLNFKLVEPLQEGTYRIHIFSAGMEVLHSKMPARYIAAQEKKTQALLSGQSQDFAPIPDHTVPAVYPAELKAQKLAGSARVKCHVNAGGDVQSVELVSATLPEFGVAALAAAPKWKFDPALKGRHFVESEAVIPFEFKALR